MREPYQNRTNYPLLLLVVALHALAFAWAQQPVAPPPLRAHDTQRAETAAAQPAAPSVRPATPTPSPAQGTPAATDANADDPRRLTPAQWQANQEDAAAQQQRAALGELAPLAADPQQLLQALEQALLAGRRDAAAAAAEMHDDCSLFGDTPQPLPQGLDATLLDGLSGTDQALVRTQFAARVARLEQLQRRCAAWQEWRERLATARRAYAARADADRAEALRTALQLDPPTPDLFTRLRAALQQFVASQSQRAIARAIVLQLLEDPAPAQQQAGLRLLLELAERDDAQAEFAAGLLRRGHGGLAPQPALAQRWQRRAADLGSAAAVSAELAQPGLPATQAWAWHAWRVGLNAQGCYLQSSQPADALLVADLRGLQQLEARLDAAGRDEALALWRAQAAAWNARARALQHCDAAPAATTGTTR